MADRKGVVLRRRLWVADRMREAATCRGLSEENTPGSRSSALLVSVTRCDQRVAVARELRVLLGIRIRTVQFRGHKCVEAMVPELLGRQGG